MSYFRAPALDQLVDEVDARWPNRGRESDGWIGDTSHAARPSDHNPDPDDDGIVRAQDITNRGIDVDALLDVLVDDPRVRYIISRGRIWTRDTGRWADYTGPNPHDHHVHVSIRSVGNHDRDASPWGVAEGGHMPLDADDRKAIRTIIREEIKTGAGEAVWDEHRFAATSYDGQELAAQTPGQRLSATAKRQLRIERRTGETLVGVRTLEGAVEGLAAAVGKVSGVDPETVLAVVRDEVRAGIARGAAAVAAELAEGA